MSNKTRTRKTRTTAALSAVRPVPDDTVTKARTDTEDKLWEALHAHPNATATELSVAAKIGKSTAQKTLVKWAGERSVTRTAGIAEGGRRAADLWAITEDDPAQDDNTTQSDTATEDGAGATGTTQVELDTAVVVSVAPDAPATDDAPTEVMDNEPSDTPADDAHVPVDSEEAELVIAVVSEPADNGAATRADTETEVGADATGKKTARLAPGALRGMVEDHLRDHPGSEFSPVEISRELGGRSTGAVSNALDKLAEDGVAVQTKDKPKRFALASAEHAPVPAPTN